MTPLQQRAARKSAIWRQIRNLYMAHRRTDVYLYNSQNEKYFWQGKVIYEKIRVLLYKLDGRWPSSDDVRLDYRLSQPPARSRPRVVHNPTEYGRFKHLYGQPLTPSPAFVAARNAERNPALPLHRRNPYIPR